MSKLKDLTLEDILIEKPVPIVEANESVSTLLKFMARQQVSISLISDDNSIVGFTTTTSIAEQIVRNLWDLNIILDRFTVKDLFKYSRDIPIFKPHENLYEVIKYVIERGHSIVVDKDDKYYELSPEDLISLYLLWEDVFNQKETLYIAREEIVKVPPTQSLVSTYNKYKDRKLDAAIVVNIANYPVGIVTDTDYTYSYEELARELREVKPDRDIKLSVDVVMNNPVIFEFEDIPASDSLAKMVENDIGHLPIVNRNEEVIGMVYKFDVLMELVKVNESS